MLFIHIDTKFHGYMLNPFGIILFYKVVEWFDGQDIGVEPKRPRFKLTKCQNEWFLV
jgi:hypothetical protein